MDFLNEINVVNYLREFNIEKAFNNNLITIFELNNILKSGYEIVDLDDIEKAEKDLSKLIKKEVYVSRGGKTFKQTVWVRQKDEKKVETPIGEEVTPIVKGMNVTKYSDKSVLITGDTYVNVDTLRSIKKEIGVGSFNSKLKGWVFPIKFLDVILGFLWSDQIKQGNDEKAEAIKNQKNAGLEKGDNVGVQGMDGKIEENVSDSEGTKYNITLNDGTKLENVDEKILDKNPETDDKKISESINNATPESRIKVEKKLYGIKPIQDIHNYSLKEYMLMHGLTEDDVKQAVESLKPKEKKEIKPSSGGGTKKEYTKPEQKEGLTKQQLIRKLVYAHYQAVKKAIEEGKELKDDVLNAYSDLKENYSKKRQAMSEETKRKISEALKKNKTEEKKKEIKEFIDNMSKKDVEEIKNAFVQAKNELVQKHQSELASFMEEKSKLEKEYYSLHEEARKTEDYSKKNSLQDKARSLNPKIRELNIRISTKINVVQAINNGGDLLSFKDKIGSSHKDIADFRNINTKNIYFDIDNILNEEKPKYIPEINEEKFKLKGYVLDAIRIDNDSYMVATQGHNEKGESLGYDYKTNKNTYSGYNSENSGYVIMTLDQLVLTNDYYITKQKAKFQEEANKRSQSQLDAWDKKSDEQKEKYINYYGAYNNIGAKLKKQFTKEEWGKMSWREKEKHYKPVKKYGAKKLKTVLEEGHMWTSFHDMHERFVDPTAKKYKKVGDKIVYKELGDEGGSYGHPITFMAWNKFSDMLNWKMLDIKIQREVTSDIRKAALETSFGESNTNNILQDSKGILVKRQNGETIKPLEIDQLSSAWDSVQESFGTLIQNAKRDNLKLSHSGNKHIYSSKAVGVYIPSMKTIGVSSKYGEQEFGFTLGHEVAHWIDDTLGSIKGKRYMSDDYESTAGKIAFTLRKNMNEKSQSSYYNATHECFARAMEMYHAIESSGEKAQLFNQGTYFAASNYVSKEVYENQLKPLIKQFLEENKEILKSFESTLFG